MDSQANKRVEFGKLARSEPVFCDTHPQEIARAVCLSRKTFLCLECAIDNPKEPEWKVISLGKVTDEKDNALIDCMYARQQVRNMLNTRLEYEKKTLKIEENMTEQVLEFHKKLSDKLDDMKEKTLKKIKEMSKSVREIPQKDMPKLNELNNSIEEEIKLLEQETDKVTSGVSTRIQNVQASLKNDLAKLTSEPSKGFKLNESLDKALCQSNALLAFVSIYDSHIYEEVGKAKSSDGDPGASKNFNLPKQKKMENNKGNRKMSKKGISRKVKKDEPERLPEKNENDVSDEPIYDDVMTFENSVNIQPKHLLNKSLRLSSLDSKFTSACKFSKIVYLGEGRMAMLSKVHSLVAVVGLDDTYICSKSFNTPIHNIAALNKDTIAVLCNTQIIKYQVGNKGFKTVGPIQIDQQDFTGFDYNNKKSQFAIISEESLSVVDTSGQNKKTYSFPKCGSSDEITTAYDFDNGNVCIIDKQRQALGCYSLKGKKDVFKRKRFDFLVRDLYVGNGILCISSESAVYLFSSSDGKAIVRHEVDDLVVDCSAVCEADGVIIIASKSEDMEKSKQLGFVSVK